MQSVGAGNVLHRPPAGGVSDPTDMPVGHCLHPDVIRGSSHLGRYFDEPLRRSNSVNNGGSSANDNVYLDLRRQSPFYHEPARRNSVPNKSAWKSNFGDKRRTRSPRSASPSTTRNGYARQAIEDLEAFRLARACGMPLEFTHGLSSVPDGNGTRNFRHDEIDEVSPFSLPAARDREPDVPYTARMERGEPGTNERDRSRPRSLFVPTPYGGCIAPGRSIPVSPTYPNFARRSSSAARFKQGACPVVPTLHPTKQLTRISSLLSLHSKTFFRNSSDSVKRTTAESLIDVHELIREHELDILSKKTRCSWERGDLGVSFSQTTESGRPRDSAFTKDREKADYHVFGEPLSVTRMYASCESSVAGYRYDLPIVVHACVEELYRTGMTVPGLFRSPPHVARHNQLIEIFDNGPSFGRFETLSKERTEDICALLRSYIDRLPHPIWHESLFDPMLELCVSSSVFPTAPSAEADVTAQRENGAGTELKVPRARPTSLLVSGTSSAVTNIDNLHVRSSSMGDITSFSICRPSSALSTVTHNDIDFDMERPQILLCQAFFRLLPCSCLTLLAYLCAFFSQLPLCSHNQLAIEDIARFFAVPLFLGKVSNSASMPSEEQNKRKKEARMIMVWILRRWSHISEGLFDAEDVDISSEDELTSPSSSDDSESVYTFASDQIRPTPAIEPGIDLLPESPGIEVGPSPGQIDEGVPEPKGDVEQEIAGLRRTLLDVHARLDFL